MVNRVARHREFTCQVCNLPKMTPLISRAENMRPSTEAFAAERYPNWTHEGWICTTCLNRTRADFVRAQMEAERGELTKIEHDVIDALHESETIVEDLNRQFDSNLSIGQAMADKVASFGGSWKFIIIFVSALSVWILWNLVTKGTANFDPYPFILLNLALSLTAALQAPIIMMSQNRAGERDRMRAEGDYKVNLKAELEVRAMAEKIDQLIHNQWMRLMEIQQIQMEMLDDLHGRREH